MLSFVDVTLQRGANILLEKINLTLFAKQKVGLIGKNGSGKSTLFSALLGDLATSVGTLQLPGEIQIAHLAQETPALEISALEFVVTGDSELAELEKKIIQVEQTEDFDTLMMLHARLADIDGYSARARAAKLLDGLGFKPEQYEQHVKEFSGGYRMRLNLARCLMCRSDLLLLDEPTNHLDLETIIWLEKWLRNYSGTLIIISHDRDFLDGVVDTILHVEQKGLKLYKGNYSEFEELRAQQLATQQAQYIKQQTNIAHLQSFVDRFKAKASKAKQAQSRVKAIQRMELLAPLHKNAEFRFEFLKPEKQGNPLLRIDKTAIGYDDKIILQKLNFSINSGARVGLLGKNGAGKSTFIQLLTGKLPPLNGEIIRHSVLKIGYFAQHQVDYLALDSTPLNIAQDLDGKATQQQLRSFLGSFGFPGERVFEPIAHFSGGEKARLALALIVWQKPNLLLLDEPTNHLDLDMREALYTALQNFEGAMILVSHDRYLLRNTVNELWLTQNGTIKEFDGDVQDYLQETLNPRREKNS